jgi:hypothetical protein
MELTGLSRRTLMRHRKAGTLTTRLSAEVVPQRQPVIKFRRSELSALASKDEV